MISKKKLASLVVVALITILIYVLRGGTFSLTEVGVALALAIIGAIFAVLWWGFGEDITRLLGISKSDKLEQELTLLISPMHAKLNENSEIIDFMAMYGVSRIWTYREDSVRSNLETLESEIKGIMLQHGPLAQDRLYGCIQRFLDLNPKFKQRNGSEAKNVLLNVKNIVKDRQDELRTILNNH
jgi:hypothetical protein